MSLESKYSVRQFQLSDGPSFFEAVQDSLPDLAYWMPWCKQDYTLKDAEAWMSVAIDAWKNRNEFPLGIFEVESGSVVGGTGINHINKAYRIGNIGYWVSSKHVGRGVARFAAKHAALLGFGELGLTRLEIIALTHNLASQRVAAALGAVRECEARNRLYFEGKPHDAVVFSLAPIDVKSW